MCSALAVRVLGSQDCEFSVKCHVAVLSEDF